MKLYTTGLAATIHSLLNHSAQLLNTLTLSNISLPHNNATISAPTPLPPDPSYFDYPTTAVATGQVKLFSYGPLLNYDDKERAISAALNDVVHHLRLGPNSRIGPELRIYISGNVELVLAPKPRMTWKIWIDAFNSIRMFYFDYSVALIFKVIDNVLGDVGGGWVTGLLS
ncbi:hypothetical protein OEA41_006063 [Lepraria neglecta]|uniref:Uncharacterized protein n=1 Tax=Lepraria neglecta TaxID=209136 RepID=A0AAD9Z6Y0_9LECA|nr:hypothetical protein OEA41_006063 [Lepraria neglecta]